MAEPLTVIVERWLVRIHFCTTNFPMEVIAMLDCACSHNLYRRPKHVLETLVTGDRGRHALGCDFRLRMENAVENPGTLGCYRTCCPLTSKSLPLPVKLARVCQPTLNLNRSSFVSTRTHGGLGPRNAYVNPGESRAI